jgi:3-methyladenine DNA glycosylase/8-oxoguanine DNA glycosylase
VLAPLIRSVGPCGLRATGDPYRALLRSILFQQLAGAAARAIEARLLAHFSGRYPRPEALRVARDADLRSLGLSRQKIAAFRSVASHFSDGSVRARRLFQLSDEEVVGSVTQIRGVGVWTAHMLLMFSLGRPDVLPVGDYGIRKGAQLLYALDELPGTSELERIGERWRPWRSVASWYVWRYAELETPAR